jgi:hypothetical protein
MLFDRSPAVEIECFPVYVSIQKCATFDNSEKLKGFFCDQRSKFIQLERPQSQISKPIVAPKAMILCEEDDTP